MVTEIINSSKNQAGYEAQAPPANSEANTELVTSGVIGNEYSVYGIGLGQFFLFISIWVGVLMLTFVMDRKRRGAAAHPELLTEKEKRQNKKVTKWHRFREAITWWWSKISVMLFVGFFQVTILSLSVYALGYSVLGSTFWLLYLQLLFSGLVFTVFIGSLWMFFRDDVIGKFIAILFLIVNLSSGWGTFPPSMQFKIFEILSYIAPFTYQLKNVGAIVYGVGIVGANAKDTLFILGNVGISLIYLLIGVIIGVFAGVRLTKMQLYGSRNKVKLATAILELNHAIDYQYNNIVISSYSNYGLSTDALIKYYWTTDYLYEPLTSNAYINISEIQTKEVIYNWEIINQLECIKKEYSKKDKKEILVVDWDKLPYEYNDVITKYYNQRFPFDPKLRKWSNKHPDWVELDDAAM